MWRGEVLISVFTLICIYSALQNIKSMSQHREFRTAFKLHCHHKYVFSRKACKRQMHQQNVPVFLAMSWFYGGGISLAPLILHIA